MPTLANIAKINGIVISGAPAVSDAHTLIATQTATASPATATLSFTLGLDSLYDVYEFRFDNLHPSASEANLLFQVNAVGQSGFNETITSTLFRAYQLENAGSSGVGYRTAFDHAQDTAYINFSEAVSGSTGFDDASGSGVLTLYAPSSTTYVKHFVGRINHMAGSPAMVDSYAAGYINTTAAIDEISFKFDSGNIDAGTIKMYGIAKA